ncbi:cytochrome P450 81Q32-like [Mercurialis annua]|uniref:cytochrome P450 81Q32-like n=1 Tax=Mercurialis annua TaxID=3986 RepID=UPI00215F6763|nr:cytochrome P450 81Q32-like [Mercurialis annua]
MEETLVYTMLSVILGLVLAMRVFTYIKREQHRNLPPSPPSLPIIGHLHLMLKQPRQRTLHDLSNKYGPIMSLRLGTRLVVVVSSASVVEECFTKNDIILANRPHFSLGKYVLYNNTVLVTENYNQHWRNLRRISTTEILSTNRLNQFLSVRKDEVNCLLRRLRDSLSSCHHGYARVGIRPMLVDLSSNVIMRMVAGKRYYGAGRVDDEGKEFQEAIKEFSEIAELFTTLGDLFPGFKWLDAMHVMKLRQIGQRLDSFLQRLIHGRRSVKCIDHTMIDHLLTLQESEPDYYSDQTIKGLILVLLIGGSLTSATTLEWAIANLLNRPSALNKAKSEIESRIGEERLVDESDLPSLKYLESIVHETLRMYPTTPLLVPHLSSDDCTIGGFHVPADTILVVNAWAVQRDAELWDDPTSFKPERFENGKVERFKLLPFGMGRRACPGEGLAMRTISLTLASLIQCFDWETVDGKQIDMTEKVTVTMRKVEPLELMLKARPILQKISLNY